MGWAKKDYVCGVPLPTCQMLSFSSTFQRQFPLAWDVRAEVHVLVAVGVIDNKELQKKKKKKKKKKKGEAT
jgi:hypothetical protein